MNTPADRLNDVLDALGFSQAQFASRYGINRQTMYSIASGRNVPSLGLLVQMCEAEPRISAEYLLRGEGQPLRDMKTPSGMEIMRNLLEMQAHMNQFIEKKARTLQD